MVWAKSNKSINVLQLLELDCDWKLYFFQAAGAFKRCTRCNATLEIRNARARKREKIRRNEIRTVLFEFLWQNFFNKITAQSIKMSETRRGKGAIADGHLCHTLQSISEAGNCVMSSEWICFVFLRGSFPMWRKLIASEHQSGHRRYFIIFRSQRGNMDGITAEIRFDGYRSHPIHKSIQSIVFQFCCLFHFDCPLVYEIWAKNHSVAHHILVVLCINFT